MKLLYQDSALITNSEISNQINLLKNYLEHFDKVLNDQNYSFDESSINLPFDKTLQEKVLKLVAEKKTQDLKYIIDIGIGGSNLGTKAIYDGLYGSFDLLEPGRFPKMIFLDTVDPEYLERAVNLFENSLENKDQILINTISKSGSTTETLANLEITLGSLKDKFPDILERLVITTDENSKMDQKAKELGISCLTIPKLVGGRYSVFSSVGLFPLALAGLNTEELREGARKISLKASSADPAENLSLVSAIILFLSLKNDKTINDNFFFHPELESIGKWYRQLMGESIGKEENLEGMKANTGITPTVSLGSTDLHSVGQLYIGGPKDKITTFVYTSKSSRKVKVPEELHFSGIIEHIKGKGPDEIMSAIFEGVKYVYKGKGIPFMEVILHDISEKSLGEFLQFKMLEMMYLGRLLDVNTFDQPDVESYKVETKSILSDGYAS